MKYPDLPSFSKLYEGLPDLLLRVPSARFGGLPCNRWEISETGAHSYLENSTTCKKSMPIGIYWPAPVLQEQKKYAKFLCISMTSTPLKRRRILGTETKTIGKNEIAINASFVFLPDHNFLWRVWSWLRTNAGGVLNTCKSNDEVPSGMD